MNFTQDILPNDYSVILQQDCPIYIVNVKQIGSTLNIL